jgi:hypothetical protein
MLGKKRKRKIKEIKKGKYNFYKISPGLINRVNLTAVSGYAA